MKEIVQQILPPVLYRAMKSLKPLQFGWFGEYASWSEAAKDAVGYESEVILKKVEEATRKVLSGDAAFERDSVPFANPDYNWPLLAGLMYAAARNSGKLNIIDFGGSLGSTYYQNRIFLSNLPVIQWNVVEQKHFVQSGKQQFSTSNLHFYNSVAECLNNAGGVATILFSSVLQYIEKPYHLLDEVLTNDFKTIIIDRMPFNTKAKNRICVQKVPESIYRASYPCHLLNYQEFIDYFQQKGYHMIAEYDALDGKSDTYQYKGLVLER